MAISLFVSFAVLPAAADDARVKTPFRLVSLWSDEMLAYLTGVRQRACSGADADPATCRRVAPGVCDGTAYFHFLSEKTVHARRPARERGAKQTESSTPQYFALELSGAGYGFVSNLYFFMESSFNQLEMVFNCSYSGNEGCPSGRFQTGRVRLVELGPLDGQNTIDVTKEARVLPDGPIVVPVGQPLKDALFVDRTAIYRVRAVAECFSVEPTPVEWTLPVFEGPSTSSTGAGAVVVRVNAGEMDFRYRTLAGQEVPFTPDWVQPDWGYSFEMDQTVLDRKGNWFQLPPRPFPRAVWVELLPRELDGPEVSLDEHRLYRLSKSVRAVRRGGRGAVIFPAGTNIFIAAIRERALEIRGEEPFDMPCSAEEETTNPRMIPTYVVDGLEFYDGDLHLQLSPAYPKGC